ncbi:MAG: PspC domain-containing protein [Egibacteraceae bacterium]
MIPYGGASPPALIIRRMDDSDADQQPADQQPPHEDPVSGTAAQPDASSRTTAAPARRLTRRTDQKVLGGVAGGLAAYFDHDPVIWRLAFVALGFVTFPFGIVLYLVAWAAIPADTQAGQQQETGARRIWILLLVLAAAAIVLPLMALVPLWLFGSTGRFGFDGPFALGFWEPDVFWALLLVGLGVLLFQRSERADPPSTASSTAAPAHASTEPTSVTRPPRRRSVLGRLAAAAALIVAGLAALLDNLGMFNLSSRRLLALLLLVVGVALLVGAWWGAARWLIVIGILLVCALFSMSVVDSFGFPVRGPFGDRTWRPTSRAEVATPFELGFGDLTLDLTRLPPSADVTHVAADVGMSDVEVIVPADADVTVNSRVGFGQVDVFGRRWDGVRLEVADHASGQAGAGRFVLDIENGFGDVTVRRGSAVVGTGGR